MPLTDLDAQLLAVYQVGDIDPVTGDPVQPTDLGGNGLIVINIGRLWDLYADKALFAPRLRDLYVRVAAQDICIARLESLVSFSGVNGAISVSLGQRVQARQRQREAWAKEIIDIERNQTYATESLMGQISTIVPITPPTPGSRSSTNPFGPDANGPEYSGSPYWGKRRA